MKWTTDIMDGLQKHYAESKKQEKNRIHTRFNLYKMQINLQWHRADQWGKGWEEGSTAEGHEGFLGGNEDVLFCNEVIVSLASTIDMIHKTIYFKWINLLHINYSSVTSIREIISWENERKITYKVKTIYWVGQNIPLVFKLKKTHFSLSPRTLLNNVFIILFHYLLPFFRQLHNSIFPKLVIFLS